jgi:Protein of unknown function DUF2834
MTRRSVYLLLFVLGTVIPYSQFVPWVLEHGLNVRLLIEELFVNRISSFFAADVLVSSVVVVAFLIMERRRLGIARWLPVAALCFVGVSAALPLALYLREGRSSSAAAA